MVYKDGTLKHEYPESECLWGTRNGNGTPGTPGPNYSTYEQELLAGMLVLSCQHRPIGGNYVVWLCDHEPIKSFQNRPPPEKAKVRGWWTPLRQMRLKVYYIQGMKNENANFISCNNFDARIGASSEVLAREAVAQIDVHLDLNIQPVLEPLLELNFEEYRKELSHVLTRVPAKSEAVIIDN